MTGLAPHDIRLAGTRVEPPSDGPPAHLAATHPQYPDGFPSRLDDSLLGHWRGQSGVLVVEEHPHGYEIHVYPCYNFNSCDACAPDRGSSNPHTEDGHDFRSCSNRNGPILTVAGDRPEVVLEYLAVYGSAPHIEQLRELNERLADEETERRRVEREATLKQEQAEQREAGVIPTVEERLEALAAEIAALKAAR
jgi:hypothetical protein